MKKNQSPFKAIIFFSPLFSKIHRCCGNGVRSIYIEFSVPPSPFNYIFTGHSLYFLKQFSPWLSVFSGKQNSRQRQAKVGTMFSSYCHLKRNEMCTKKSEMRLYVFVLEMSQYLLLQCRRSVVGMKPSLHSQRSWWRQYAFGTHPSSYLHFWRSPRGAKTMLSLSRLLLVDVEDDSQ